MSTSPTFVAAANVSAVTFVNADGTTPKTLWTPGASGGRLGSISAVSDDTAAREMALYVRLSGVDYRVGTVNVPIGAGNTASVVSVNILVLSACPWLDSDGSLKLQTGATIKIGPTVAVTAAKTVTLVGWGGDF